MKVKLGQVVNSVDTIRKLTTAELPLKLSFRLMALIKQLDDHLKIFEELRGNLIRKYGEESADGSSIQVKPENIEAFSVELGEALQEEIEVDFVKISIEYFPDTIKLSPTEIMGIEWMLEL